MNEIRDVHDRQVRESGYDDCQKTTILCLVSSFFCTLAVSHKRLVLSDPLLLLRLLKKSSSLN